MGVVISMFVLVLLSLSSFHCNFYCLVMCVHRLHSSFSVKGVLTSQGDSSGVNHVYKYLLEFNCWCDLIVICVVINYILKSYGQDVFQSHCLI